VKTRKRIRRIIDQTKSLIPIEMIHIQTKKEYYLAEITLQIQKIALFFKKNNFFSLCVLLPFLICFIYILFIKTPVYQSTARILIEREQQIGIPSALGSLVGQSPSISSDVYISREHLSSREMLENIQKTINLKEYYQDKGIDFISRLSSKASFDDFLKFYKKQITSYVHPETNELVISINAFSADMARDLLSLILESTKTFVNRVSNTLAQKQYDFTEKILQSAKINLFESNKEIIEWQNNNQMFDPKQTAGIVTSVMASLTAKLVEKQTELITLSAFMQPTSNKILALKEEINAIQEQIETQTSVLLGKNTNQSKLNKVLSEFEWIQLKLKFAQAEYEAAQHAHDSAMINLSKNQNILVEIEAPSLANEKISPKPAYDLITIFVILCLIFLIVKLMITIIREHTG